ncbi:UNVERIFIED_CONTAM: hypothetical protein Sindi_0371100 [Sesamum indicum]
MATTTRAAIFWLMATITVATAIGFIQLTPLPVFPSEAGDETDDPYVNTLMWCLRQKNIMPFPKGPFSSQEEDRKLWDCRDIFDAIAYDYESNSRLERDYVEALRLLHGKNEAAMDNRNHIYRLSLRLRSGNDTLPLPRLYRLEDSFITTYALSTLLD